MPDGVQVVLVSATMTKVFVNGRAYDVRGFVARTRPAAQDLGDGDASIEAGHLEPTGRPEFRVAGDDEFLAPQGVPQVEGDDAPNRARLAGRQATDREVARCAVDRGRGVVQLKA